MSGTVFDIIKPLLEDKTNGDAMEVDDNSPQRVEEV